MSEPTQIPVARRKPGFYFGWLLTVPIVLLFSFSAYGKFAGGPDVEEGFKHLQLEYSFRTTLGVLEVACVVLYLLPPTAVMGAILLTGYLGGAILTHLRVGDPVYVHGVLGVVIWLALALREPRLWSLIPWRRPQKTPLTDVP